MKWGRDSAPPADSIPRGSSTNAFQPCPIRRCGTLPGALRRAGQAGQCARFGQFTRRRATGRRRPAGPEVLFLTPFLRAKACGKEGRLTRTAVPLRNRNFSVCNLKLLTHPSSRYAPNIICYSPKQRRSATRISFTFFILARHAFRSTIGELLAAGRQDPTPHNRQPNCRRNKKRSHFSIPSAGPPAGVPIALPQKDKEPKPIFRYETEDTGTNGRCDPLEAGFREAPRPSARSFPSLRDGRRGKRSHFSAPRRAHRLT